MTPAALAALAGSPRWAGLSRLALGGNDLYPDVEGVLADGPVWRLTYLSLRNNYLGWGLLTDPGPAGALAGLQYLDLSQNRLGCPGELAANPARFGRLRVLLVEDNGICQHGAALLAEAPGLAALTALGLRGNQVCPDGVRNLLASPHLTGLERLDLAANPIGPADRGTFAMLSRFHRLTGLDLGATRLGDEVVCGLAVVLAPGHLERLALGRNAIGSDGVIALAASPALAGLRSLDLTHNLIDQRGAAALAVSPNVRPGARIDLEWNPTGAEVRPPASPPPVPGPPEQVVLATEGVTSAKVAARVIARTSHHWGLQILIVILLGTLPLWAILREATRRPNPPIAPAPVAPADPFRFDPRFLPRPRPAPAPDARPDREKVPAVPTVP